MNIIFAGLLLVGTPVLGVFLARLIRGIRERKAVYERLHRYTH
jgi:hypothetical protein